MGKETVSSSATKADVKNWLAFSDTLDGLPDTTEVYVEVEEMKFIPLHNGRSEEVNGRWVVVFSAVPDDN